MRKSVYVISLYLIWYREEGNDYEGYMQNPAIFMDNVFEKAEAMETFKDAISGFWGNPKKIFKREDPISKAKEYHCLVDVWKKNEHPRTRKDFDDRPDLSLVEYTRWFIMKELWIDSL